MKIYNMSKVGKVLHLLYKKGFGLDVSSLEYDSWHYRGEYKKAVYVHFEHYFKDVDICFCDTGSVRATMVDHRVPLYKRVYMGKFNNSRDDDKKVDKIKDFVDVIVDFYKADINV